MVYLWTRMLNNVIVCVCQRFIGSSPTNSFWIFIKSHGIHWTAPKLIMLIFSSVMSAGGLSGRVLWRRRQREIWATYGLHHHHSSVDGTCLWVGAISYRGAGERIRCYQLGNRLFPQSQCKEESFVGSGNNCHSAVPNSLLVINWYASYLFLCMSWMVLYIFSYTRTGGRSGGWSSVLDAAWEHEDPKNTLQDWWTHAGYGDCGGDSRCHGCLFHCFQKP